MGRRGRSILQGSLALAAALLLPQAHAAGGQSPAAWAARTGSNTGSGGGGAMQWMHQIDSLTTVLDHLQKLFKYGPYAPHVKDAPKTSEGRTPKGSAPSPGGDASTRACTYPAGYPRAGMPALADILETAAPIKALIIKEIPSHADAPAAPDLAKWSHDSLLRGLAVEAGPVLGAYLVKLPYALSARAANAIIRQMYIADMLDTDATPGCLYDYIEPDLPLKTLLNNASPGTGAVFPPAERPQISTTATGPSMLDTNFDDHNEILGPVSPVTARYTWPLLGAWANTPGDQGQPPHPLAITAVAVIDPTFYAADAAYQPIPMPYQGPIHRVTRTGLPGDTEHCREASESIAKECHGDIVAAVIGQRVRQFVGSDGVRILGGGALGRGLFYRGAQGDPTTSEPLYGNLDTFPIERVESGQSLFTVMSALAYAAGRPMGYRPQDGGVTLTDQVLDAASGVALPGVKPIAPLSPAPRVVDLSLGQSYLAATSEAASALCDDPFIRDTLERVRKAGIMAVVPSGNVDDDYRDLQLDLQDKGGRIVMVPGDCKGFQEVGGAELSIDGNTETAINDPQAIEPAQNDAYWEPFKTHILTTGDAFESSWKPLAVSGTSIAAPRLAATIAMMFAIDPALDTAQVDTLLRSKAITFQGTPDIRMVSAPAVWFKVMRMAMKQDLAALDNATATTIDGKAVSKQAPGS